MKLSAKNKTNKQKRKPFYNLCYDLAKITGAPSALLWLRPKIYYPFGKPSKKGALLVSSNHCTFIDPIIIQLSFPWRRLNCLATKDLFERKVTNFLFTQMHCIVVDKDNFSLSSFHEVVDRLNSGKIVVIFPEGQVNTEGRSPVLAFKSGAVLMAHRAGAPILPMYIVKRDKWYHRQRVIIGETVDVCEMLGKMPSMEDMTRVSELLREKEVELKEDFEALPIYKRLHKNENDNEEFTGEHL